MLEWIVSADYISKKDQYHWPWCKLVLKKKMIKEDKQENWTNEKVRFVLINDQFFFC